ncbi:MAG TPA: biotin/lipoyl-containing protein [Verrucomicrobiae bacterium]|jgi:biotin carboxyl carrier protein|nr:biotin/lipoyl-containing protein [Verrucomicrobiae bacterium]
MRYEIVINGARRSVEFIPPNGEGSRTAFTVDGRMVEADAVRIAPSTYSILISGRSLEVTFEENSGGLLLRTGGREFQVEVIDPRAWRGGRGGGIELEGRQQLVAPMPGKIVRVLVTKGQQVENGQGLLVIEAMKMQNEVRSPKSGTVEKVAKEGQTVNAGEILAVVA